MPYRHLTSALLLATVLGAAEPVDPGTITVPDEAEVATRLAAVPTQHPFLFASAESFAGVRTRAAQDPRLATLMAAVLAQADKVLADRPVERVLEGRRLLGVSRTALRRCSALGAAYQLTGEAKYAERGEQELQAICGFTDWNPAHFLDVGEMTLAVATGYDWLYAGLSPATRATIRETLVSKGITPSFAVPAGFWVQGENNWTQVCHAGMMAGALAIHDTDPALTSRVLRRAITALPRVMQASFAPDGAYPEGPGYWEYGTTFNIVAVELLRQSLARDYGVTRMPGFLASADYMAHVYGPSNLPFNYADSGSGVTTCSPAQVWMARERGIPWTLPAETDPAKNRQMANERFLAFALLWAGESAATPPNRALDWHGAGIKPVALFRSAWGDPQATWLGVVAGSPGSNHSHMDAGAFVFESLGVRWGVDMGMQNYNSLETQGVDLWNMTQKSQRWTILRQNNHGHSTLVLGGQLQQVAGKATFTAVSTAADSPGCTVDLTSIYAGQAATVERRFSLPERQRLVVEDRITGLTTAGTVRWQLVTGAAVAIQADGRQARLTKDGKALDLRVVAPADARLVVADATPRQSYDAENPGIRILAAEVDAKAGADVAIQVHLDPVRP